VRSALLKAVLVGAGSGVLIAAMTSCAVLQTMAQNVERLLAGAVLGALMFLVPIGALGSLALAGFSGGLVWLLSTPAVRVVNDKGGPIAPGSGGGLWGFSWRMALVVAAITLILRAWGHAPVVLRAFWAAVKPTARALLGGPHRPNGGS